jgi:hypothetical protein
LEQPIVSKRIRCLENTLPRPGYFGGGKSSPWRFAREEVFAAPATLTLGIPIVSDPEMLFEN